MADITPLDVLHYQEGPSPGYANGSREQPHLGGHFFLRTNNPNVVKVFNIKRSSRMSPAGIETVWAFSGEYPKGMTSLQDIKAVNPKLKATPAAIKKIEYLKGVPEALESMLHVNALDYKFRFPPYPHQLQALEYTLHYNRLALVLDMGLGKTFIMLAYTEIMGHRTVVLAPKIALGNWMRETLKFTGLKPVIYHGTIKQREKLREAFTTGKDKDWDVLITNYESLTPNYKKVKGKRMDTHVLTNPEDIAFFRSLDYSCFVLDEASRILGHDSERGKAIVNLAEKVDHRYLLSGTLSQGKPLDVFMPLKIMDATVLGGNYYKVRSKYCTFSPYNKHVITGYKNLDELKSRIDPYMLCMTKEDNLSLPERLPPREKAYDLTDEQIELYNAIVEEPRVAVPTKNQPEGEIRCPIAVIKITKLLQVLSGFVQLSPKRDYTKCNDCPHLLQCMCLRPDPATELFLPFERFPWSPDCLQYDPANPVRKPNPEIHWLKRNPKLELLDDIMESVGVYQEKPEKLIIWAQFKADLDVIKAFLKKKKVSFVTPADKESDKRFQTDNTIAVYVGQVSQGIAINLTEAAYTVYYSHSLVLDHRDQSMDRNYRIGQKRPTFVFDMVAPETIESAVLRLLEKKCDVKNFIQQNKVCTACKHSIECFEKMIKPYSEDCIHYDQRLNAEAKMTLKFDQLGV